MMGGASLPPGFRFHPTDEELVGYYLHRKVQGLEIELEVIPVIDLYKFDPWELPEKSFLPKRDMEWFFFCPRDRKYPNGSRTNRATKAGYWKATGKDRQVTCQSSLTGYRKTLVFYRGRAPLGDRTDWVMHEYRLSDEGSSGTQGAFALCRVVKKNEPKSKAIASSSSNNGDFNATVVSNENMGTFASSHQSTPTSDFEPPSANEGNQSSSLWVSQDYILDSSKDYPQVTQYFPQFEYSSSTTTCWQTQEQRELSSSSSYPNFIGEIEDFNRMDYMSSYSTEYMGFGGNEDMHYEYYDQTSSQGYFGN